MVVALKQMFFWLPANQITSYLEHREKKKTAKHACLYVANKKKKKKSSFCVF